MLHKNLIRDHLQNKFAIKSAGFLVIAFAITFLSACKSRQKLATVQHQETKVDTLAANQLVAKQLLDSVLNQQLNAEWISAKASVDADIVDDNKSFNVTLRIRKDSAIWVSINAILGVEAARVLITRDSLKLIDRIHNKFAIADYEYLADILHIKVDYQTIESLLLGNFFGYRKETKFNSVYVEDKYYILSTLNKRKLRRSLEDKDPNKPIVQDFYIDPLTYRILSMNVEDDRINKTLHTTYTDFHPTEKGLVPLKSETKIIADKNISIRIEYTKFNLGEIEEMPFRIPASFERIVPPKKQ